MITCGFLWCFYRLIGLSFWRHPFTAENPLVTKWCNAQFFQICSDEQTNSSTSWMAWGWEHFQQVFFLFRWIIPLISNLCHDKTVVRRSLKVHILLCEVIKTLMIMINDAIRCNLLNIELYSAMLMFIWVMMVWNLRCIPERHVSMATVFLLHPPCISHACS